MKLDFSRGHGATLSVGFLPVPFFLSINNYQLSIFNLEPVP